MEDYEIIGWPEIQHFMELEEFDNNSTHIEPNKNMGIGSLTYLVDKEWLESFKDDKEEDDTYSKDIQGFVERYGTKALGEVLYEMVQTGVFCPTLGFEKDVWKVWNSVME